MSKKGKIKNGNNKAKHTKLLNQKKNKIREAKELNKKRLKAIVAKSNEQKIKCNCDSGVLYDNCCAIAHSNISLVKTAEQLMRSRYTAYVLANIDYLMQSHHSSTRPIREKQEIVDWTTSVDWIKLEVLNATHGLESDEKGTVEFKAYFKDKEGEQVLHENSKFVKENNHWVYLGEV